MVILKLQPEQISRHWDVLREVLTTLVMDGEQLEQKQVTKIAEKLISEQVQCWAVQEQVENEYNLVGFVFTSIVVDAIMEIKNLLLLGLYTLRPPSGLFIWTKSFEKLLLYARGNGCKSIIFYTNVPVLLSMAKKFGANVEYTYGVIPT